MTDDQRQALETAIASDLNIISNIAGMVAPASGPAAPALAVFALIGKAVAAVEPKLVEDAVALINKATQGDPTDAEEQVLADSIQELFEPEKL